ncbi:hypothetical protein CRX72_15530 [Pantoea sp. BRM17]|nr:hypothetical protein CRX72_15530 [Pantoea sp. BRM17]
MARAGSAARAIVVRKSAFAHGGDQGAMISKLSWFCGASATGGCSLKLLRVRNQQPDYKVQQACQPEGIMHKRESATKFQWVTAGCYSLILHKK